MRAGYSYTQSQFPGTPETTPAGTPVIIDRLDHYQNATLELTYQVLHWLSIRPYARYQARHSNDYIDVFDSNIVGIEFLVKRPQPAR